MHRLQKGFTLIEMLVVIAIISILIGIGINTFTIAQKKARDVRRKADLRQLQTLIAIYIQDKGKVPGNYTVAGKAYESTAADWFPDLVPNYASNVPVDPLNKPSTGGDYFPGQIYGGNLDNNPTSYQYAYGYYDTTGDTAWLATRLENKNDSDSCYSLAQAGLTKNSNVDCTGVPANSGSAYVIKLNM